MENIWCIIIKEGKGGVHTTKMIRNADSLQANKTTGTKTTRRNRKTDQLNSVKEYTKHLKNLSQDWEAAKMPRKNIINEITDNINIELTSGIFQGETEEKSQREYKRNTTEYNYYSDDER